MERTLVTVVTEAVVESALIVELEMLGVSGYTITDARGRGSRGTGASAWRESSKIRIEVICAAEIADQWIAKLREKYQDNFAMLLWRHPVDVLQPGKIR